MRKSLVVVCLALAAACSSGSEADGGSASSSKPAGSTKPAASTAPPPASASVKIDKGETKPGIAARVKAEVDNRTDGLTGTVVAVSGAKVSFQGAKDWTTTTGDVTLVSSADKKANLGAAAGTVERLEAVAAALGLRECQWSASESITIGKDKLPGSGADGLCKKNDQEVKAAMVAVSGEDLLLIGAWEAGGDDASIFASMRSISRGGGQGSSVAACCRALEQNAVSAPPDKKGGYLLAIGACKAALANKDTAAAIRSIQSAAKGIGLPAECK